MKSHLKTHNTVIKEYIDKETGELLDQEIIHHQYMTEDKEQFFLVYSSLIGLLGELSLSSIKVLSYILLNYKVNSKFEIGGATRKLIAEQKKLGNSSVANALTELKTKNILYSTSKSIYMINPRYAFQGSSSDRKKAMKAIIELGCKNC